MLGFQHIHFRQHKHSVHCILKFIDLGICCKLGHGLWVLVALSRKVKVKVAQSCPTLCNPMDYTVHGILQARTLEWVAFPFSRGSSKPRDRTQVSHIAGGFFTRRATREAQINTLVDNLLKINSIKNCTYFIHQRISCFISQVISF